jgi:hypothetical protein
VLFTFELAYMASSIGGIKSNINGSKKNGIMVLVSLLGVYFPFAFQALADGF